MLQWIANLFSVVTGKVLVVETFVGKNLKVDVKEYLLPSGHIDYFGIIFSCRSERGWIPAGLIAQNNLTEAAELLEKARTFLKNLE